MTTALDFSVERSNLANYHVDTSDAPTETDLEDGQILLRVEKFAFTANNITYGVAGDMIGYWKFFPAAEGLGRIPVWGIGTVEASSNEGIQPGERYYGYYPMSTYFVASPAKVNPGGFFDSAAHRQELPPTYNQYQRVLPETGFKDGEDDYAMVFRPLFGTAFLLDDFIADNDNFGAENVILTSASSKTAFGVAHLLSKRTDKRVNVIGLTSPGNVAFVEGLGYYDRVVTYDNIDSLPSDASSVLVDMAGNASVMSAVHTHFGDALKYSCTVGITHWQNAGDTSNLPGPDPIMFFAPSQGQKRAKELGLEKFQAIHNKAWAAFVADVSGWISFEHGQGADDVGKVYTATLEGKASADTGYILTL